MKKGWGEERCNRIARFRLGNEMEKRKYWEEEEKIGCRRGVVESWEHVWEDCRGWKEGWGTWQGHSNGYWEERGRERRG